MRSRRERGEIEGRKAESKKEKGRSDEGEY